MTALYDRIGLGYASNRQPDTRIAEQIHNGLGSAISVLNVGAGSGSYEPADRDVVAVEPSTEMIRQRLPESALTIQAVAEQLPFPDKSFDAAMAILTVHHWSSATAGLRELARVARERVAILTFDPVGPYFWLADYIPEIIELDQPIMPRMETYSKALGMVTVSPVPVPHDCTDGFLGAYWRRPDHYLDPDKRNAISTFAKLGDLSEPLSQLEADLASGQWHEKNAELLDLDAVDIGYRLVVADLT